MLINNLYPEFESDKTQKWVQGIIRDISVYGQTSPLFNQERYKTFKNYDFIAGVYDMKDLSYMTEPLGVSTPATWRHYDLIRVKYEKILGDYMDQPLSYYAHITNREGHERKLDAAAKVGAEVLMKPIYKMIHHLTGVDAGDKGIAAMSPEDQALTMGMNAKDKIELFVVDMLDYLINRYNLDNEYVRALFDMCVCGKAFTYTYMLNGMPMTKRVDPRCMIYDADNIESDTLSNSAWQAHERYLTINEILGEYRNYLTPKQVSAIKLLSTQYVTSLIKTNPALEGYFRLTYNSVRIRVIHTVFCSVKDVYYTSKPNKYDPENPILIEITDEELKDGLAHNPKWLKNGLKKGTIKSLSGDDWWHGVMIGPDTFTCCERLPDQPRSQGVGAAKSMSPYNGVIHMAIDGMTYNLTDRLQPWQILWNEIMFNIDFLLGRTNGKVMQYDDALRPETITRAGVFHLAKNHGLSIIDSRKDGRTMPMGNQFSVVDMSNSADLLNLINMAERVEALIDATTGLNRGWSGDTKASDTLGNTQNNVVQANSVLRPLYQSHARVVEQSLNTMGSLLKYSDLQEGQSISYLVDDELAKSFMVPEGFGLDDLGIKIKTGFVEKAKMDQLNTVAAKAIQSGALDYEHWLDIFDANTAAEAKAIFRQGLNTIKQNQTAMQQANMEQEHEKNVAAAARGQVAIEVAKINADSAIATANIKEKGLTDRNVFDKEVEHALLTTKHSQAIDQMAYDTLNQAQLSQLPPPPQEQLPQGEGQPQSFPQQGQPAKPQQSLKPQPY